MNTTETYLPKINQIFKQTLREAPCQVYLFGSRAAGRDTSVSDFDVAIWSEFDLGRMPSSVIVRDASIQRFEYSFEITWKLLKAYLTGEEGIICDSPKRCFREALHVGLLPVAETEICLTMPDDRNLTLHTYIEEVAQAIYEKLPLYLETMDVLRKPVAQN